MSLKIAIYARFSSENQRDTSIDDQVARCVDAAARAGWAVPDDLIFADPAISGASDVRPRFQALRRLVVGKPRGVDVLIVDSADRLSRNVGDADRFYRELEYAGVRLICIADGIDSDRKGSRFNFSLKAVFSDYFLDSLREATMRGLEGRMRAGFSTGGLPLGFASDKVGDERATKGFRRRIDEARAPLVVRIFELYRDGFSYRAIAQTLNDEGVAPPRPVRRGGRRGWVASTIREMLRNEAYVGIWSYKKRRWQKAPGTNARRPKRQPAGEVIKSEFPELRIIPAELWNAVQARRAAVASKYDKGSKEQGSGAAGRRTSYPFSGLLTCGCCGAPMVIAGGSSARYYKCGDALKRGTCSNRLGLREDEVRVRLFAELKQVVMQSEQVVFARRAFAKRLGERHRELEDHVRRAETELAEVSRQIDRAVAFIVSADNDPLTLVPVKERLSELQSRKQALEAARAAARAFAKEPIRLPSLEEVRAAFQNLEVALENDPVRSREALRRFFGNGTIALDPQPDGSYVARSEVLPLVGIPASKRTKPPNDGSSGAPGEDVYFDGCAGRI